ERAHGRARLRLLRRGRPARLPVADPGLSRAGGSGPDRHLLAGVSGLRRAAAAELRRAVEDAAARLPGRDGGRVGRRRPAPARHRLDLRGVRTAADRALSRAPGVLISVLMPVRDGEPYLREALESILAQTHRELEVVVVDDGSDDATPAILSSYGDPRLRV